MNSNDFYSEAYEHYDDLYNSQQHDRQARRKRRPRKNPHDRQKRREAMAEVADLTRMEAGFETTYQPSRHEEGWLLDSIKPFMDMALISDVLAAIKGGKEASVYRCQAHPDTGLDLLAVKVYRPRMFRNLRKDHVYRQGRDILTPEGRPVGLHGERIAHAVAKKTAYGMKAAHTSWLMHEYTTIQTLFQAGAAVPEPFGAGQNAILMGYIGDAQLSAPTLHEVGLDTDEIAPLFDEVVRNIELMLAHGVIHGDLSAYNILYWDGAITLIDFPQVVDPNNNRQAYDILQRDITRVCDYFTQQGVDRDARRIMRRLWRRYIGMTPLERSAEEAKFLSEPETLAGDDDTDDGGA